MARPRPRQRSTASMREAKELAPSWRKLKIFLFLLGLDVLTSALLLTPLIPRLKLAKDLSTDHYTLHGSLIDLALLAIPRILSAFLVLLLSYYQDEEPPESPFDLFDAKTGERKSKEELEAEFLEEPFLPKVKRCVFRCTFLCEFLGLITGLFLGIKCLARLNVEIGILDDAEPQHPLFWIALATTGIFCAIEVIYLDTIEIIAGQCGRARRKELAERGRSGTWVERVGQNLTQPLLGATQEEEEEENDTEVDEEQANGGNNDVETTPVDDRARSDITADATYKAKWTDLLMVCAEDKYLITIAFLFLLAAALANILVPRFTGNVLDALVAHTSNADGSSDGDTTADDSGGGSILHIPGFVSNIEKLVVASLLGGIFGGIRGAIFTIIGARVNVRLRVRLMDSILSQDISFFEMTRTGDLTSRLSSDTTLVGSAVSMNVNIFLRSIVQAIGVLLFMFFISWQLSLLAFITIPAVSVLSKMYGRYIRRLSKLQQKKLAEGNSVSESAISAMSTVRAFGAETVELDEFEQCMANYLTLNQRAATAALGFQTCIGALPELVKALVLFYGGLLVQTSGSNHITGGELISFILYLSYLSSAFNSLGGIFASLTRAIGAADKVFELMNREPRLTHPSTASDNATTSDDTESGPLGIETKRTHLLKSSGLHPSTCEGLITLQNVVMKYPARPNRVVLDNLSLTVPPGSVCALVGSSGSGKSSVVSLIQHLYEPSSGSVCIDGIKVHELSPEWLCRQVSVVSQEPTLFARSVRRNIIYGLEGTPYEPTEAEIRGGSSSCECFDIHRKAPFWIRDRCWRTGSPTFWRTKAANRHRKSSRAKAENTAAR
jgi:ABC-type multidrug transport system fused ATPase/permease subunit